MRFLVLLIGFVGILLTGAFGICLLFLNAVGDFFKGMGISDQSLEFLQLSLTGFPHNDTAVVLFLTALYGLFGTLLGFLRCGKQGGVLLLVPPLFAAWLNPLALAVMWVQMFAGLLSMFVSPLPINAPSKSTDDDD